MIEPKELNHLIDRQCALKDLKEKGYFFIEDGYSEIFCKHAIKFIDSYNQNLDATTNYLETELRIWDAHKKDKVLSQFSKDGEKFLTALLKRKIETKTLLAIKNKPLPSDDEALRQGRWHVDSFTSQVKIFLFLTDTTQWSGPFEFVPGTHKKYFKLFNMPHYFKLSDFRGKTRKYQSLSDRWIEKLAARGYQKQPVVCKAGTIFVVDTTAIHRASPCLQTDRYALTIYARDKRK